MSPSPSERWLVRFGTEVRDVLRKDSPPGVSFPKSIVLSAAHNDGWWSKIAEFRKGGGQLCLFLNKDAGGAARRLYYGIWASTPERIRQIERIMRPRLGSAEIVESERATLEKGSFDKPLLELDVTKTQHYYGTYRWQPPVVAKEPSVALVNEVSAFSATVFAGLAERGLVVPMTAARGAVKLPRFGRHLINPATTFRVEVLHEVEGTANVLRGSSATHPSVVHPGV